jgi:hypothetical protein
MPGLGQQAHDFDRNFALDQPSHTMCPSEVTYGRKFPVWQLLAKVPSAGVRSPSA